MPSTVIFTGTTSYGTVNSYQALRTHLRSIYGDTLNSSASITTEDSCNIIFNVEDIDDAQMAEGIAAITLEDCKITFCTLLVPEAAAVEETPAVAEETPAPAEEPVVAAPVGKRGRRRSF